MTTGQEVETRGMTLVEACNSALDLAFAADESVFVLGEDVSDETGGGVFKVTKGLSTKYGSERVLDTPIAEQAIIGAAIGAALAGMRPVAEIMIMDFMAVCADQIINHAAKLRYMSGGRTNVPLTICTAVGGGRGSGPQHSQSLEALLMHSPGVKVVFPSTPYDAKGLLTSCIFDDDPCVFMESMTLMYGTKQDVPTGAYSIPLGSADVKRKGDHVTVVTYGRMVPEALKVAESVIEDGIDLEVVDLRSLVPLDMDTVLTSCRKTRRVLVLHAASEFCGPGAEIAARISRELHSELLAPVERLGAGYAPIPFAPALEAELFPTSETIETKVRKLIASTVRL